MSSAVDQWLVDWQALPKPKSSYANGGKVVGPKGIDNVHVPSAEPGGNAIRYMDGEYVIPRDVVEALGRGTFDQILEAFHTPIGGETS